VYKVNKKLRRQFTKKQQHARPRARLLVLLRMAVEEKATRKCGTVLRSGRLAIGKGS